MRVLLTFIYKFTVVSFKVLIVLPIDVHKLSYNSYRKVKNQEWESMKNKDVSPILIKMYKAIIVKIVWYWQMNEKQVNGTEQRVQRQTDKKFKVW